MNTNNNYTISLNSSDSNAIICTLNYDNRLWTSIISSDILTSNMIDLNRFLNIIKIYPTGTLQNYSVKFLHKVQQISILIMIVKYDCNFICWVEQIIFTQQKSSSNMTISNHNENILTEYEKKLKQERQERQNAIKRERKEQQKKLCAENEKKKLQEQENLKLIRILNYFNSKDLPEFNIGRNASYPSWHFEHGRIKTIYGNSEPLQYFYPGSINDSFCSRTIEYSVGGKFQFTLENLQELKKLNSDKLNTIRTTLCEDLIWIEKYVYGDENTKPFVDYIYDNYIENNKLLNIIDDLRNKIDKIPKCTNYQCDGQCNWHMYDHLKQLNALLCLTDYCGKTFISNHCNISMSGHRIKNEFTSIQLSDLDIKLRINKLREYYYINYEEFLDLFGTKHPQYGHEFQYRTLQNITNLDSQNNSRDYSANDYYYNFWHIWDREKLEKLSFLKITNKFIQPVSYVYNDYGEQNASDYFYEMEKRFILSHKTRGIANIRATIINNEDFDKFVKIAKIIIELIEFMMSENN